MLRNQLKIKCYHVIAGTLFSTFLMACGIDSSAKSTINQEKKVFSNKKTETYVISSPIEGVLLENGKPIANATIIRSLRWNTVETELTEKFITDNNGVFKLPIHEEELSLGTLSQFSASMALDLDTSGDNKELWYSSKFNEKLYGETDGPITSLVCDITQEKIVVRPGTSKVRTICRWENMPAESEF